MLIIGERINSTRKGIGEAIRNRDEAALLKEARVQKEAGANMLDVNCAMCSRAETEDMKWLVETVQRGTDMRLSIDSPSHEAIAAGLAVHKGKALVNSISLEKDRAENILSAAAGHKAAVIALTMDEKGLPSTASERLGLAERIIKKAESYDIPMEDLYIDPLVRPVSSEPKQAAEFLAAVREIKRIAPVRIVCGLSNVSFGLPERGLMNSVFLAMALGAGLDAAIIDPSNKKMKTVLRTADALMGNDEYCMNYITAFRSGELKPV